MTAESLADILKNCNEKDIESLFEKRVLKNITEEQVKSLLSNRKLNISLIALENLCSRPYSSRGTKTSSQYAQVFRLIRNIEPHSLEAAFEEYFIENNVYPCFDSILWSNLRENDSIFLFNNPKLNFIEELLDVMFVRYEDLGETIQLYEWYNYSFKSDVFFRELHLFPNHDLMEKILEELETNDESEIGYILSLNLLKFVDKKSVSTLLNSSQSNLFETLIKLFVEFDRAGIYDNFELCEDYVYQLGKNITQNLKDKVISLLEDGKIDELEMILKFRWLEYFTRSEIIELSNNTGISFLENFGDIIYRDVVDESNYYRGMIFKYFPTILLTVLKFVDAEFLNKIFKRDEVYDRDKKEFIWLLKDSSAKIDELRKGDINEIITILNT